TTTKSEMKSISCAVGNRMKCLIALGAALLANSAFATIITDPVGDASGHADVVALSGAYSRTSLFLSAQFQPDTLDPAISPSLSGSIPTKTPPQENNHYFP